jgi:methyl-accepting chemotaxis protein
VSNQASARVEERLAAMDEGTARVMERMGEIAAEVERARPSLDAVEAALRSASDRIAGIDERAAKAWAAAAEQVNQRLEKVVSAAPVSGGMSGDAVALLRRIAGGVEASRPPSPVMLATLPLLGTLGALAIVYALAQVPRVLAFFGL